MSNLIKTALVVAEELKKFPLSNCSPSDDPDKQYAYSAAFRDITLRFLGYVRRIKEPYIQELLNKIDDDIDSEWISLAHSRRARLIVIIDYLIELDQTPGYFEKININQEFVDKELTKKMKELKSNKYDLLRLNRYIEELNDAYQLGNYISSILLIRAILNHIPPIFGEETFNQVVKKSKRSIKGIISIFEDSARPIADLYTHMTIRRSECIPTKNQIDPYKSAFETLLNEIVFEIEEI